MSVIYARKTQDRRSLVEDVMKIFEGELRQTDEILLKPNIVSHEGYPTTTHPETLRSALSYLTESGKKCIVADGPAFDAGNSSKIIDTHPLKEVCNEFNVPPINIYSHRMVTRKPPRGFSLKLSQIAIKSKYTISLPVLKTHFQCAMSGALKNQFGYLSRMNRIAAHIGLKNIDKCIAELNALVRPDLFIVDAVQTLLEAQEIRHGGESAPIGQMIAGKDPVSLDSYGLTLLQQLTHKLSSTAPNAIPYIRLAQEYGVGQTQYKLKYI